MTNTPPNGLVTGFERGTTNVTATYQGTSYSWQGTYCLQSYVSYSASAACTVVCGDQRDNIIQEYVTYQVQLYPTCENFTQTAHSYYFSFGQLNTGDYAWALVKKPLAVTYIGGSGYGLDDWRYQYGASRIANSAYRNPARNARVGGAAQSRHMYGDAADLANQSYNSSNCGTGSACQNEWNTMINAAISANADYTEPSTLACGYVCAHADWRNHDPGIYAQ